ncbi:hypothetical protein B0O80DRAFT_129047 [Mortierella sp. GBAus27b]|nr:hypothetical protein B0O80DRAFT_129047 [Mortierella sp. GBAus27b]
MQLAAYVHWLQPVECWGAALYIMECCPVLHPVCCPVLHPGCCPVLHPGCCPVLHPGCCPVQLPGVLPCAHITYQVEQRQQKNTSALTLGRRPLLTRRIARKGE